MGSLGIGLVSLSCSSSLSIFGVGASTSAFHRAGRAVGGQTPSEMIAEGPRSSFLKRGSTGTLSTGCLHRVVGPVRFTWQVVDNDEVFNGEGGIFSRREGASQSGKKTQTSTKV